MWKDGAGLNDSVGASGFGALPPGGAPLEGVDGNWRCDMCSNINFGKRLSCHRCGAQKPSAEAIERRLSEINERRTVTAVTPGADGRLPYVKKAVNHKGEPLVGIDGNWKCGSCGNSNFGDRMSCHRCKSNREEAEVPAVDPSLAAQGQQFIDPATGQIYTQSADGQLQATPSPASGAGMAGMTNMAGLGMLGMGGIGGLGE